MHRARYRRFGLMGAPSSWASGFGLRALVLNLLHDRERLRGERENQDQSLKPEARSLLSPLRRRRLSASRRSLHEGLIHQRRELLAERGGPRHAPESSA